MPTPGRFGLTYDANNNLLVNVAAGSTSGTEYTQDAASPANPTGPTLLLVRDDVLGAVTPVEGDWVVGRVDDTGAIWTRVTSIGQALPAGDNNIGNIDIVTMPVNVRTSDSIAVAHQTDAMMSGLTALTPKFAKANIAASTTDGAVVAAVATKKLRVLGFRLHAGATATNATFTTKPAGAGTAISELFACGVNGGRAEAYCPVGHFETSAGEGLSLTTGAGSTVGVGVVYVEV